MGIEFYINFSLVLLLLLNAFGWLRRKFLSCEQVEQTIVQEYVMFRKIYCCVVRKCCLIIFCKTCLEYCSEGVFHCSLKSSARKENNIFFSRLYHYGKGTV